MKVRFLFNVENKRTQERYVLEVSLSNSFHANKLNSYEKKGGIFTECIPLYQRHDYVTFV